jgi:Beta-lactamase enzyme family
MKPTGGLMRASAVILIAAAPVLSLAPQASGAVRRADPGAGLCRSLSHPGLAARLGRDIDAARQGRESQIAVRVDDPGKGLECWLHGARRFDSASVVKVTILGALLRKALDQHRYLTDAEATEATAMITRSDNDSATALWYQLGPGYLRHFLHLARMRQTTLGADGYWGLTQITAHDEVLLLRLLLHKNLVLDLPSRRYALSLMAQVIPSQLWGVPAGAPARLTVHVKNGWLPSAAHGWYVSSIGCLTGRHGGYSIVILTDDNPTFGYGVTTIDTVARAINHDLRG